MNFQKDFDELFNEILTDYTNQFPEVDASKGSLIFMKSACLASARWGMHKHQEWIADQIFADTAEESILEHHAWLKNVLRKPGETPQELLDRYLGVIRKPPAGGNKHDYVRWALEVDNVKAAWCIPLGQGLGTVDDIILAKETETGSEIPSAHTGVAGTSTSVVEKELNDSAATFVTDEVAPGDIVRNTDAVTKTTVTTVDGETKLSLIADIFDAPGQNYEIVSLTEQVKEHVDDVRPVRAKEFRALAPAQIVQDVTMIVSGSKINMAIIKGDIETYMNGMIPGEDLTLTRLTALAMANDGVEDVNITVPAANVVATDYQIIRPGTIDVS